MLSTALQFAARGWPVVPVSPLLKRKLAQPTTDPAVLLQHWTKWPDARVGIVIGCEAGLIDLDCDDLAAISTAVTWLQDHQITPLLSWNSPRGKHYLITWSESIKSQQIDKLAIRCGETPFVEFAIYYPSQS